MDWPWVSRKTYEYEHDSRKAALALIAILQDNLDYFRASYYDLRDIVAEQQDAIEHYKKLVSGQLGDGPE